MRLRDVLEPAIAYARDGYPLVERAAGHDRDRRGAVPRALADLGRGLSAERRSAEARHAVHQPTLAETYARILKEAESGGGDREAEIERGATSLVAGLRRRGDRQVLPHPGGDGRQRRAASRRAARRRHGALAADRRGAADLRLRPLHRLQGRRLEPGPGDAAATRAAEGLRPRRARSGRARTSSICWSNARSSPSPTARHSTAIRISSTCRSRRCCPTPTTTSAAS